MMIEEDVSTVGSHAPTLGTRTTTRTNGKLVGAFVSLDTTADDEDTSYSVGSEAPTLATKNTQQTGSTKLTDLNLSSLLIDTVHKYSQDESKDDLRALAAAATEGGIAPSFASQWSSLSKLPPYSEKDSNYIDTSVLLADVSSIDKITSALSTTSELLNGSQQRQIDNMSSVGSFAPTLGTKRSEKPYLDEEDALSQSNPDFDIRDEVVTNIFEKVLHYDCNDGMEAKYITDDISTVGSLAPTLGTRLSVKSGLSTDLLAGGGKLIETKARNDSDAETDDGVLSSVGFGAPTLSTRKSTLSADFPEDKAAEYRFVSEDVSTVGSYASTIGTRTTNKTGSTAHENDSKFIVTKDKDESTGLDSSVGPGASTLSTKGATRSAIRAFTLANWDIDMNEEDDVSAVDSSAPTLGTRVTTRSEFLENKSVRLKTLTDDLSSVGSFAPTLGDKSRNTPNKGGLCSSLKSGILSEKTKNVSPGQSSRRSSPLLGTQEEMNEQKSNMGLLGGLLGRDSLSTLMEDVVGNFLRRGAVAGIGIWLFLILVILCVAPYDSYQYLGFEEWVAHVVLLVVLVATNLTRLTPYLVRDQNWDFLKSGAMASSFAVQFIAISSIMIMLIFPTPVIIDPIAGGARSHLLRWAEWTSLAFLMTFLTESIDLPLEEEHSTRTSWGHGIVVALSTVAGGVLPFCTNWHAWLCVFIASCVLFCSLYVRLFWRGMKLRRMSRGDTVVEKEHYIRAKYAFKLMAICTTLWTLLVIGWCVCCALRVYATPGTFWANDWLMLATEDFFEALSKCGYLSILIEVHSEIFDEDAKTGRRLEELRNYMSSVWDASSDVVVVCSKHDSLINAAISPAFFNLEKSLSGKGEKITNNSDNMTLVMEVDPYDGSFRTFEVDLTRKVSRDEASAMVQNYRNRTRVVTPTNEKNLAVLADLICDACTCGIQEGRTQSLIKKDFFATNKAQDECKIFCEATVTQPQGKAVVMVLRDVTQRYQLIETKRQLAEVVRVWKKDSDVNRSTRQKVEAGVLSALKLLVSMKDDAEKSTAENEYQGESCELDNASVSCDGHMDHLEDALKSIFQTLMDQDSMLR